MHFAPILHFHKLAFPALPPHLSQLIFTRLASTTSYGSSSGTLPFPFPSHVRPSPYEIFHLNPGASQKDIKSRYYELVRIHHPDSPHSRNLPAHVCHTRFQAITSAYDALTGKSHRRHTSHSHAHHPSSSTREDTGKSSHDYAYSYTHRHRSHNFNAEWARHADVAEENADDRWKDRAIMAVGIGTIAVAIAPFLSLFTGISSTEQKHASAARNLAQARRDAREFGQMRRTEIRKRVRVNELDQEYEEMVSRRGGMQSRKAGESVRVSGQSDSERRH